MASTNRTRITYALESTWGTSPGTGNFKELRHTGESVAESQSFTPSAEIRSDGRTADTTLTGRDVAGGINIEFSLGGSLDFMEGAYRNSWSLMPVSDNAGTPSSEVSAVDGTTDDSFTVTTVTGYVAGHLIRATGFGDSGNNGIFTIDGISTNDLQTSDGTALVDDAAPIGAAKVKVVGFGGVSGDITATATGLGSTALDFTTLGLSVGQWLKIGGLAAGDRFDTEALNTWARISAIAATALTLTELPAAWTTDAGAAKSIKAWVGDTLIDGQVEKSFSIEKGYLYQAPVGYHLFTGMTVNTFALSLTSQSMITGSFDFMGADGTLSTTTEDADPDAADQSSITNTVADIGELREAGGTVPSGNCVQSMDFSFARNLTAISCLGSLAKQGVDAGTFGLTGTLTTLFGSDELFNKFLNGTESSLSMRIKKDGRAIVFTFPRVKYTSGTALITGQNAQVENPLGFEALADSATNAQALCSSFEYFEA